MFRNCGKLPDINIDRENEGYTVLHYSYYWAGNFIIIQYDKSFIVVELKSALIIL